MAGSGGLASGLKPSDCKARDADSTCAAAVAGASAPPGAKPDSALYDGPLGGVPSSGYAYWGWDFIADQTGTPSPVRPDMFINRSTVPVTVTLSFTVPTTSCGNDCLPGIQFQVDAGWFKLDPPLVVKGNVASVTEQFAPGRGYGWVIGLWQATHPRLTVTIPQGANTTLEALGLPHDPSVANAIPATASTCTCWDGTTAACSDGGRFSNGLLGSWTHFNDFYIRADAFNSCPPEK